MQLTAEQKRVMESHPGKVQVVEGEGGGASYAFQPGDGTRYVVTVRPLSKAECSLHGCSENSRMFSIMRGSNVFVTLCSPGVPHFTYLREKLGLREYDAVAWERLLGFIVEGADFMAEPWVG